jgi:hypothetical protein
MGRRNPTTGSAGCCARAASGHAIAAPPSSDMNARRRMVAPFSGLGPHITTPLREDAAVHHSKNCVMMSQMGHSRRFQDARDMSDLPETRQGWAIYEYLP